VQSQAATLLLIGSFLRGDSAATEARAQAARVRGPSPAAPTGLVEAIPADDLSALGFPRMAAGPARFVPGALQRAAGARFAAGAPAAVPRPSDVRVASQHLRAAAEAFYRDANVESAGALLEVSLRHPQELVRVAAAASYFEVTVTPTPAIRILEHGVRSRDRLVRDVAAHALARVDPTNARLARLLVARRQSSRRRPSRTSTIVHGTWASDSDWWQPPNGDFWKYLHDNVDPQLYGASDRFEWSGGYSDWARADGGEALHDWVQDPAHNLDGLDLFTHSHGGSVAMLATQAGTSVGRLVLLSCPVHWPKYTPEFSRVSKVFSIRVRLDLVILIDGGGQRFSDPRIRERVLPIWFDHFTAHDPATWEEHDLITFISQP
jgi:predicted alpha/beta-hydrolase family hydrolase